MSVKEKDMAIEQAVDCPDEDVATGGFKIIEGKLVEYSGSDECVTIPEGVTDIGHEAFQNCEHLTSVVIPDGVEYIGFYAFSYCENLTTVEMPDSIEKISNCAFAECRQLTHIMIPEETDIGNGAFNKCNGLADKDGWIIFQETCFDNVSGASKLRIPDNVKVISGGALSDLHDLKAVFIPNHVTQVRCGSVSRCKNLESVVFLNDSVEIETRVFSNCDYEKLVVYARPGSTAEQYALNNGIKCAPLFANMKEPD